VIATHDLTTFCCLSHHLSWHALTGEWFNTAPVLVLILALQSWQWSWSDWCRPNLV